MSIIPNFENSKVTLEHPITIFLYNTSLYILIITMKFFIIVCITNYLYKVTNSIITKKIKIRVSLRRLKLGSELIKYVF
jgi:hypothetical protein